MDGREFLANPFQASINSLGELKPSDMSSQMVSEKGTLIKLSLMSLSSILIDMFLESIAKKMARSMKESKPTS